MAFVHGKEAYFSIKDSGETDRDLSSYLDDVSLSQSMDTAETSTFGNSFKTYLQGLSDATFSLSGKYDPTATTGPDAVLSSLIGATAATAGNWTYGPAGNTSGDPEYTGSSIMTSYDVSGSIGDVVAFSAELQVSSAVTSSTFA